MGAGPHGLSAAAHLRAAGVDVQAFGDPFSFWVEHMPVGMFLRSGYRACYISDPARELTLEQYERAHGLTREEGPVSLARFIDYGRWFQRASVPDVDGRRVIRIEPRDSGFSLVLDDATDVTADRVVIAAGIAPFASRAKVFAGLPRELVSHSSDHRDFTAFAGRQVLVVGAGQSALESAALLNEAGAEVEVVARASTFRWNPTHVPTGATRAFAFSLPGNLRQKLRVIKYPPHDVGPFPWNWLVASPEIWRAMPPRYRPGVEEHVNYPRGSTWLQPRLADVPLRAGVSITSVTERNGRVQVCLSDGSEREVDHVLLGTGYRIDVSRYPFLSEPLLVRLRLDDGYPVLRPGMESSVPGLHFLGAPAARSFGPSMRFVTGAAYGSRALTSRITGRRRRPLDVAW